MPGGIVVLVARRVRNDGFRPDMLVAGIRRVCFVLGMRPMGMSGVLIVCGMRPMIGVPVVRAVHILLPGLACSTVESRALLRSHAPRETTECEDQRQEGRNHLSSMVE